MILPMPCEEWPKPFQFENVDPTRNDSSLNTVSRSSSHPSVDSHRFFKSASDAAIIVFTYCGTSRRPLTGGLPCTTK